MSKHSIIKRKSVKDIFSAKGSEPVVCLTAYTAPVAAILDDYVDLLMVGDSLGMVVYGMPNTLSVTVDMMINHGRAVVNSSSKAMVVVDMPFGSYQESKEQAFKNAARIISETGCGAVKIEGGVEMAETISFLVERGIPVMGHIGLQPQKVNVYGGYGYHGRNDIEKSRIMRDAIAIDESGAFSMVIEGVAENLATEITSKVASVTIGIGASSSCDGQVLVVDDMLGLSNFTPKFVKKYANLRDVIAKSAESYAHEVRSRKFPSTEYCYGAAANKKVTQQ